jgi:hypothetical protein
LSAKLWHSHPALPASQPIKPHRGANE